MPVLYEYFGLLILSYSDEHDPIHVHIEYNEFVSIAELTFDEEKNIQISWREKVKRKPLPPAQLRKAEALLEAKKTDIVKKWLDFFVYHKPVKKQRITKKL